MPNKFSLFFFSVPSRHEFLEIINLTHFFVYLFIYFMSLRVSSVASLIIRRSNCINTSSGMISLCKWPLGKPVRRDRHTKRSLTQTNHTRWCKGKAVPLQVWSDPEGSRKRFPDFMTTAKGGGKVVSLTHRPPLPPGNTPGTHFC